MGWGRYYGPPRRRSSGWSYRPRPRKSYWEPKPRRAPARRKRVHRPRAAPAASRTGFRTIQQQTLQQLRMGHLNALRFVAQEAQLRQSLAAVTTVQQSVTSSEILDPKPVEDVVV